MENYPDTRHDGQDKISYAEFCHFDKEKIQNLIQDVFKSEKWADVFFQDMHHGFKHGDQVRLSCFKLAEKLNSDEKDQLMQEGIAVSENNPYESVLVAIEIAAIFHDCGRFNGAGKVVAEEQKYHHILSAKRAKIFCESVGLSDVALYVSDAILCHDFQSKKFTPELNAPETMVGKIVQSSDQMGWFHPDSIQRTLDYNTALGVPFYDATIGLQERLDWRPGVKSGDALTVMLNQLYGPMTSDRFGVEFARKKIETYKIQLEENILKFSDDFHVREEATSLIEKFRLQHQDIMKN